MIKYYPIPEGLNHKELAMRIMFLAYKASQVVGMGVFQARANVTEHDVWGKVAHHVGARKFDDREVNDVYADYLFGKMMKTAVGWTDRNEIAMDAGDPRPQYQSWGHSYKSYDELFNEAVKQLKGDNTPRHIRN